jgi:hypothetical protein
MSLALLILGLLSARSAHAQQSPGHYWKVTYDYSHVVDNHFVRDVPNPGQISPTSSEGGSNIVDGDLEQTVTATLTWVPAAGMNNTSDPPPDKNHKVPLKESAGAWEESLWGGSATPGGGTVDDGLGDPVDAYGWSQGTHLSQRDGSSGTITLSPVTLKAINPVSTYLSGYPGGGGSYPGGGGYGYWDWTGGEGTISYAVTVDPDPNPRSVMISCPSVDIDINGGSKYRSPALTGPVITNMRSADGTLRGDTVALPGDGSVSYTANAAGSWNPIGTTWHWYSSAISGASLSGDYPNIQVFNDPYVYGAFVGKTEHIFISMYDGHDGAEATGNYYMHFHNHYEPNPWTPDQPPYKVMGPDPDAASFDTPPPTYPWQVATD